MRHQPNDRRRPLAWWALVLLGLFGLGGSGACRKADPELRPLAIGGDFVLRGSDGQPFDLSSLRGRVVLLFFGYTSCPDVCPTTLGRLARVYQDLAKEGLDSGIETVFVSVDPLRDTPEKIAEYLDYFAVQAIGATGEPEAVAAVAKRYGASYERVEIDSAAGYVVEHSTFLYLIDAVGQVRHLFRYADPPERIVELTSKLIIEDGCHLRGPRKPIGPRVKVAD